ncbi:Hypothetical predicted protein [Xyrichtys novacula]|uniref:Ig-like domain-containing protein n=1 Tax=Xyrichtys novacula TaxID=13765 RepID=A0AAV1FQH4_XYRNO|nr:Hypothetical predicted protein [Xyrichtys novacula]
MFVLIWTTLLLSVMGSRANTGASLEKTCQGAFCITLIDGEIRAEAGLCVVIPCSFTVDYRFNPAAIDWFKCEPSEKCDDSQIIYRSYRGEVQPEFRGRVTQLEPNIYERNCSIIINDLTVSDSGSYQLRVRGWFGGRYDRFQYSTGSTVSVKALTQKPTVMIPPLTEGQQTTLSCTAPGLCSGSAPQITWMWRQGENDSVIRGNFRTESLSAVAQRHSSTLTFTPSAEDHGTEVTCKVSFKGGATTEQTETLNVTYVKEVQLLGNTDVKEGETLNLTCNVESFPPSLITWTKLPDNNTQTGTETDVQNDTFTDQEKKTEIFPQEGIGESTFSISNVTVKDSGLYICRAKHLNNTLMKEVDVKVIYMKTPVITGNTSLTKGDSLNLTCSVESFPPSHITWTLLGSGPDLQNDTGSATLLISDVQAENSGRYICTAKHLNTTVTVFTDVSVTWIQSILKDSGCQIKSDVLTCVCISEGFPLPTIEWPLLKNHAKYSVNTAVINLTVSSTIKVTAKDHSYTSAECVSSNGNGEVKENLTIQIKTPEKEEQSQVGKTFSWVEVIIAFLLGLLLSTVFCFVVTKCHRRRQKSQENLEKTLEMVTSQEDPLIDAVQEVEENYTYDQEVTEGGDAAAEEEKTVLTVNGEPKDVEYASIDFSVLKKRAAKKQESTETEYAEIKKDVIEKRENHSGGKGDTLEEEEEEVMKVEEEETKNCVPEGEEEEDAAVYSNVEDIKGEN